MVAQSESNQASNVIDDHDGPRITVTELPETIFGNVIEAYSHHAFERGYQVAVTELIGSLLPATEAFVREETSESPALRETLYRFERFLAKRFDNTSRAHHWVEGGSGI